VEPLISSYNAYFRNVYELLQNMWLYYFYVKHVIASIASIKSSAIHIIVLNITLELR